MASEADTQVLIIGAGLAGLSAAAELSLLGIPSRVLEARDRIGGRVLTIDEPPFGSKLELGAEFIHGTPERTMSLINAFGLSIYETPDRHAFAQKKTIKNLPDFWERLAPALKGCPLDQQDSSFAGFLEHQKLSPDDKALARMFIEGFHAADPELLSQKALSAESAAADEIEGSRAYRILEGYGALTRALLGSLPRGSCQLLLGAPVSRITWEPGRVEAEIGPGDERHVARAAIITAPPEPLKDIAFMPELLDKRRALEFLKTGAVVKVLVKFRDLFFWKSSSGDRPAFVHSSQRFFPTWWSTLPFQRPFLTGWTGGPAARELSSLSERELRQIVCEALARIFRQQARALDELVETIRYHDWQHDPFSRGAYGYIATGGVTAPSLLARPRKGTLFFAGEATETLGIGGTTESAIRSGERAAIEVYEALTSTRAPARAA